MKSIKDYYTLIKWSGFEYFLKIFWLNFIFGLVYISSKLQYIILLYLIMHNGHVFYFNVENEVKWKHHLQSLKSTSMFSCIFSVLSNFIWNLTIGANIKIRNWLAVFIDGIL